MKTENQDLIHFLETYNIDYQVFI